jgi:hypothetical protein
MKKNIVFLGRRVAAVGVRLFRTIHCERIHP